MNLFEGMTDDQTALVGCVFALFVCGTIMSLSYYIGQFFNRDLNSDRDTRRAINLQDVRSSAPTAPSEDRVHEKAA